MDQKYAKFDSKSFKDYRSARKLADLTNANIGESQDMRVRIRLRSGGTFDVVVYLRLPPPKASPNANSPS